MWRSGTSGPRSSIVAALCAVAVSGCAEFRLPRIDPSGERLFAAPSAPTGRPDDLVAVLLAPQRTVAPVGSQVVLLAGAAAGDGYLRTNRRLEWSIAPGSVGQFVSVGEAGWADPLLGDFNRPRKVTNTFAIGSTSRRQERVGLGPGFAGPVCVRPGQGWITVTSPIEGTSHLLVVAPEVVAACGRSQSAVIHWIDAQFGFPPPAINPAGTRHVLTTTVLRQSNQCPQAGWIVRYEIVGGPPAGLAPSGAAAVEVLTNATGQASTEIFQSQPAPGTNQVRIQVIRPPSALDPGGERLVVGTGSTLKTWTAAALSVRQSGPAAAAVGAMVAYCIEVCNSGDQPAREVTVSDELPDGLTLVSGTPPPAVSGPRLQWQLGELAPGQRRTLQVDCRAAQAGSVAHCVEVAAAGGVRASHCVTTTIFLPMLDVQVTGPERANVGGQATFHIVVTNRSQVAATGLIIKDRFGAGFEHATAPSPIERTLGDVGPGQSRQVDVTFRITRAGPLCHTVEIVGVEGVRASAQGCVTATESPGGGSTPPLGESPPPMVPKPPPAAAPAVLSVKITGPQQAALDQLIDFTTEIANIGNQPLVKVRVEELSDPALSPENATADYRVEEGNLVWTIDRLAPGEKTQIRVQSRSKRPAERACNRAIVTTAAGDRVESQAYIEIRAAAGPVLPGTNPPGLAVTVTDLQNPVAAGQGVTYLIRVTNPGTSPESQVMLVAPIPAGTVVDPLGTSGPGSTKYTVDSGLIQFTPLAELASKATESYRIRVKTQRPGQIQMHVEATSRNQTRPVAADKTTKVLSGQE